MPGCNSEEARSPFLNHKDNQPKWSQHFRVQFPESYTNKILFIKDSLPDGVIFHL
jgi:hypothetical protein